MAKIFLPNLAETFKHFFSIYPLTFSLDVPLKNLQCIIATYLRKTVRKLYRKALENMPMNRWVNQLEKKVTRKSVLATTKTPPLYAEAQGFQSGFNSITTSSVSPWNFKASAARRVSRYSQSFGLVTPQTILSFANNLPKVILPPASLISKGIF